VGPPSVCRADRRCGACHRRGGAAADVHSELAAGQRALLRRIARLHAQGVSADRRTGQSAVRLWGMRQDRLALSRACDAGLGAHRRPLPGCLGTVGQPQAPAAGTAILMPNTLALTCELMSRASVSPSDGGCQSLIAQRLGAIGFSVEGLRFGPVDNLWA